MNSPIHLFPLFVALLVAADCQTATPVSVPKDGRVTVTFVQPEKFTDALSDYSKGTDQAYLDNLRRYIERTAPGYLADGQRLTVKFTDIDMAGELPAAAPRASKVRFMVNATPPRLNFSYIVTDAAGQTVSQGEEKLLDFDYLARNRSFSGSDPLLYEKTMLIDWMSSKLGR